MSYLYVKNLPLQKDTELNINTNFTKIINFSLINLFGSPYFNKGHRDEKIIFDMIPKKKDRYKELGTGTRLGWHTEDAHLEESCKFISLFCLKGDENAYTKISNIDFSEIKYVMFEKLCKSIFEIQSDLSYKKHTKLKTAIINFLDENDYYIKFDSVFIRCLNKSDQAILRFMDEYFNKRAVDILLKSGEQLIINNEITVHARSNFSPNYDDNDRWLQRVIVR